VAEPHLDYRNPFGLIEGSEGTITGTVVCAAAIAAVTGHVDTTRELSLAILGTVAVYWIAHLHASMIGSSLTYGHHPFAAFKTAFWHTLPIAGASVVPLGVLLVLTVFGASLRTAAYTALFATIGLLVVYSYLAGVRAGLDTTGRLAGAAAGGVLGVLVVLLKVALH